MAYDNNKFCWHGIISTDTAKAEAFYSEVLGWKAMKVDMGGEKATMFSNNDIPRAHLGAPQMDGEPSHWSNYLRVTDVDAAVAASTKAGGTVLVPPTDIPPGRFSMVKLPSGAVLSLFRETGEASNAPNDVGGIHWTELQSTDVEADLAWLEAALGVTHTTMPMPQGNYYLLNVGETQVGGAMASMPGAPSMWLAWIHVEDVDETLERVTNHGGQAFTPLMDAPGIGRMAVVSDSTGAAFGIITPAAP